MAILLLQTPFAKNLAKETIISIAKEKGIELTIGKIDGIPPFEWTLKEVHCTYKDEKLFGKSVKLRLAILPLFKRELEISYLKIQGGCYEGIPFKAIAKGSIDLEGNDPIRISHFLVEGDNLFIRLEGEFNSDLSICEGNLAFYLPDLSIFKQSIVKGSAMGMGEIANGLAKLECFGENLHIDEIPLAYSSITLEAKQGIRSWEGSARLSSGHIDIPVDAKWKFLLFPEGKRLAINDFRLSGPELSVFGKLHLSQDLKSVEGSLFAQCQDLKVLRPLLPESSIKGSLGARLNLQSLANVQDIQCQIEAENFSIYETSCESLIIESNLHDLYGGLKGGISIEGESLSLSQMKLSQLEIKSTFTPENSPFEFSMKGIWEDPIEIKGSGSWQKQLAGLLFNVDALDGFALKRSISLQAPFSVDWASDHFTMTNFSMDIGYGHLLSRIDLNKNSSVIKVNAREFPLEFVPFINKHFSLAGTSSFDIDLISRGNDIHGTCNIALERAHLLSKGSKEAFPTKGSLQIHLNGNLAQVHGQLKAKDKQFINLTGSFPIQYRHFPFQIAIDADQPFSSQLVAEGKLEDLFNFINIGQHRIEGWVSTSLNASKTLKNPSLFGTFELQDGLYENYNTGTYLKQIYASAAADQKMINLTEMQAIDAEDNPIYVEGQMQMKPLEHFPFSVTADLDNLHAVSLDTIVGNCTGKLKISGNLKKAKAEGKLKLANATFRIPEQLPASLPQLPIRFINPPEKVKTKTTPGASPFPLELDIEVNVPKEGRVEGRGLNAELKGKLHITGMYKKVIAKGKLQLVSGEYIFSGKVFKLNQGELIFRNKSARSAYISVSGNCDLPDVSVTVLLEGPLTSPKLTFQSSPHLPTSSILSQILFNKDISEISAVQALQVAQTVISLSGSSGPDILEKIRKTIGIDRLTLITSENDPGKISLQIGKYLMRGVLLTLSQGTESRNVSVEVDLRKGIKFQAEFNEEQQGKFSLKWHHHY